MLRAALLLPALLILACNPEGPRTTRDAGPGDGGDIADADGDTISDADEGAREERDTDGDGTPDYLDLDSDGDGIPDAVEAGDDNPATPPVDSDLDLIPDYLDLDSDGNGIPDEQELPGDIDSDGKPNHADLDDDNDGISDSLELNGMLTPPLDTDGDGVPDFQDRDSDNDTIMDGHERDADTDGDGTLDVHDQDSDDDGITDREEAGDGDVNTPPVDTDMDGIPDFRDADSDNDGLSDRDERAAGTSPILGDTDMDGVSDLIEVAAGTSPTDPTDSPRARGDFVFTVPYMAPPDPTEDTLTFRTSIQFADVYFLFDISGSMSGEINALRTAVTSVIGNLTCADSLIACTTDATCGSGQVCSPFSSTCVEDPSASSCVASVWTGTGYYEVTLENALSLQSDPAATSAAIRTATYGGTERLYGAVEATASGSSTALTSNGCTGPSAGRIGCPAFREEAVRILVAFTDEPSYGGTLEAASAALTANGITLVGVNSGSSSSRNALVNLANASGSVDRLGAPLVYDGTDSAVVPAVTNAINEIVEGVPLRVTISAVDEPDDVWDALQFIERLETNTTDTGCSALDTEDADPVDGVHETYPAVTPGSPVCWDVIPRMNTTVMPDIVPIVARARLTVYGDGSPLDSRLVYFLIPPRIEEPGGPD